MSPELLELEKEKARAVLPEDVIRYIEECQRRDHCESYLIPVLHRVQDHFGYLGTGHMDAVSVLMQIPAAKVTGVASFYHFFTFAPRGEHQISVCMGTACFVKGADRVLDKLRELLGIEVGQTTEDGLFSIDMARCVGACALAPVMLVDDTVHAQVKPGQVAKILSGYGYSAKKGGAAA
jgi:NADH:ubiquinone oxidoreductase subunit E